MSRSYKKHPFVSTTTSQSAKHLANRKVRRACKGEKEQKGNSYKKLYCSWDIRDYIERGPSFEAFYQKALQRWKETGYYPGRGKKHDTPPTREFCRNLYNKWYLRK